MASSCLAREGWYEDPADHHQFRWFSEGAPTALVMDDGQVSTDAISLCDPALFADMELDRLPDTAPALVKEQPRPRRRVGTFAHLL